jgi:tetratricopeptide (TPR) repeat protein
MGNSGASLLQRAVGWHNQGRIPDAAAAYRQLLAADPGNPDALHLLGVALAQMGAPEEAIGLIRAAVKARPDSAMAHNNLGNALKAVKRYDEALVSYERALTLKPDYADAYSGAGQMLLARNRPGEALGKYERAVALRPQDAGAHFNRGVTLTALERHSDAAASYERAVQLKPDLLERHEEALASFERAIVLQPQHADAHYNRGNVLGALRRHDAALASFDRALALQPNYVQARWNSALLKLLRGEWREGWELYEARFAMDELQGPVRRFAQPRWRGRESVSGKAILLWAERGLGDTIQFSRYVSRVRAQGADVILQVQPALKSLLGPQFPHARVIAQGEDAGAFDYHCPLLSLPLAFRTDLQSIPADIPYLRVDPDAIESWARRLPGSDATKIGIAWQGNPDAEKNWARGRSIPLSAFHALAREPGVRLISLQTGVGAQQLADVFRDRVVSFGDTLDPGPNAFLDTAAVMMSLDLVITADTSIAHLAGALGIPVWVALHATSEWRWLLDRRDSPWYPTMKLFRQRSAGDWSAVFDEMAAELHG